MTLLKGRTAVGGFDGSCGELCLYNLLLLMKNNHGLSRNKAPSCFRFRMFFYLWEHREPNGSHLAAMGPGFLQKCLSHGSQELTRAPCFA